MQNFSTFSLPEKIHYFDEVWRQDFVIYNGAAINNFLKQLILSVNENLFIRNRALQSYIDAVLLQKVKIRQALALLIDDWSENDEEFLEVQRLKSLFLFYDHEPDLIEEILTRQVGHEDGEISAEANYSRGLIFFQKALTSSTPIEFNDFLKESLKSLSEANQTIENRIDAQIFIFTIEVLQNLLNGLIEEARINIQLLSKLILEKELFTFDKTKPEIFIGFCKTLSSVIEIKLENPSTWLSFREDFNRLYLYYSQIQNERLERRLNASLLVDNFKDNIKKRLLTPFFAVSMSAEKARLIKLQTEVEPNSDQYLFLQDLIDLSQASAERSIAISNTLEQKLKSAFPKRTPESIKKVITEITNLDDVVQITDAYEILATPSHSNFLDSFFYACVSLQGNRLYWNNALENDRNTYIATLLEAAGYRVKDQTLWSESHNGKASGEIDILVKDNLGYTFTVIEALNLSSLDSAYLTLHIDKLFKYDANGSAYNYILVYSTAKGFDRFWKSYCSFVSKHNYKFPLQKFKELEFKFTDMRVAETVHIRNNKETTLIHIVLNLNKP